jgi:23S rRNA pseudouridine1911/1915/1917 synthase
MAVVDDGKEAVTHFNVLEHFKDYTLVECQLETGVTGCSNPISPACRA